MFPLFLTCVLLTAPGNLEGKVVRIADGDTITVLVDRKQVKVRLSAFDAPERGQDFSQRSRQALADLVFGKEVSTETHGKDRYVRVIGDVYVGGKPVNEIMVRQGWAWNFVKYSKSPRLSELERQARLERRGLWAGA
jgi:micrococcal nuclease